MTVDVGALLGSFLIILVGAELFTNGIEWFGKRLNLSEGAVGSILAATGTALPETTIPVMALISPGVTHADRSDISIGAIIGAPFMLSTVAFCVTGAAVLVFARLQRRSATMHVNPEVLGRDLRFFFLVYVLAIASAFLPPGAWRWSAAAILFGLYAIYTYLTLTRGGKKVEVADLAPLHFRLRRRSEHPRTLMIVIQVVMALACMMGGAHFFVVSVSELARRLGISAMVLSTIVAPIATELPEKFNSVTWVRQHKDTLALGNISGAMVFQSSALPAFGILVTDWTLDHAALASAVIAIASALVAWFELRRRGQLSPYALMIGGIFYLAWLAYVLA